MEQGSLPMQKPRLHFWQIWNMSFGFLGIQFGFALQNANASRILQNFGADVHHLSWFWLVAPVTGLIVQPIIGHMSDRTWNSLGRRKPFFLAGAILACVGLVFLPNSAMMAAILPPLLVGAGFLMIMDASFNIAMEPFRALVADMLPDEQNTLGFSVQTFLIGVGAVVGSWLPYVLANYFGISNQAPEGQVPDNVIFSFYFGAITLLGTIIWTVTRTREYPPEEFAKYNAKADEEEDAGFLQIFIDFKNMPTKMKQLGTVQFLSWFALFSMWVFTTPAVATHIYGAAPDDSSSQAFSDAGDWVGVMFGIYNFVSAIYAMLLPTIARKTSRKATHALSLIAGGIGLISIYFLKDPQLLIISMVGVGMAWGSILAMPYAMLASAIPAGKMGIYMGIFNFFIVIPQIVNGIIGGLMVKYLFGGFPIYSLILAGIAMIIAAFTVTFIKDE